MSGTKLAASAVTESDAYQARLEPVTQDFVDTVAASGRLPFAARSAAEMRAALAKLQAGPIGKPDARIEDLTFPVGPKGTVSVRIVRPKNAPELMPVVMFFHGGGWVAGDVDTHDRLVRELAIAVHAAVVFVVFSRPPEAQFPLPVEEAYAATAYVVEHAISLNLDATRLAVIGDGAGGNIAAAVTILSKQRRGPKIALQVLFYPMVTAGFAAASYREWRDGPWLTEQDLAWLWNAYLPERDSRSAAIASPLNATTEQLHGLPDTLVITAEADVLRDEAEAYARKLSGACVRTTCTRYIGTIHDFVMLNALADTPAARDAIGQASSALRSALT
jgi:acetyl esterase